MPCSVSESAAPWSPLVSEVTHATPPRSFGGERTDLWVVWQGDMST